MFLLILLFLDEPFISQSIFFNFQYGPKLIKSQ